MWPQAHSRTHVTRSHTLTLYRHRRNFGLRSPTKDLRMPLWMGNIVQICIFLPESLCLFSSQLYWDIIYITICKFKVYNMLISYPEILQNDYHHSLANTPITSHNYHFFVCVCVRTFKICSQLLSSMSFSIINYNHMLCIRSPELITGILWPLINSPPCPPLHSPW